MEATDMEIGTADDFSRRERKITHDGYYADHAPAHAVRYTSIEALIGAVNASGSHFFSTDALSFFDNVKLPQRLYCSRLFITRDKVGEGEHGFTVRYVLDLRARQQGRQVTVESLTSYGEFTSRKAAESFIRSAVAHYWPEDDAS
jgi:hypothetical protein